MPETDKRDQRITATPTKKKEEKTKSHQENQKRKTTSAEDCLVAKRRLCENSSAEAAEKISKLINKDTVVCERGMTKNESVYSGTW